MAGSLNKVMLIGNLGKDPEVRTFEGGGKIVRFSIIWRPRRLTGDRSGDPDY